MDPSKHAYYPPSMPSMPQPHYQPQQPPPPYYPVHPNPVMPPVMPSNDFQIIVRGHINRSPREFAIDIVSNGQILLHMNPRFYEQTTVFNSEGVNGWGSEERKRFNSLTPNSNFIITIHSSGGYFHIDVNGEKYVYQQRIVPGQNREVRISKVKNQDVNITNLEMVPF